MVRSGHGGLRYEINVTPLIDVLLVLLILFLVLLSPAMRMETMDLPRRIACECLLDERPTITLEVRADLSLVMKIGTHEVLIAFADLPARLRAGRAMSPRHPEDPQVVYVDFDDAVPWGEVVSIIDTIRGLAPDPDHAGVRVALAPRRAPAEPAGL